MSNKLIEMKTPLVEMDGDEMTRIIWQMIKDDLLLPFIDLKTEYYDLGLKKRDETNDQITLDAAEATKKYGVAVKCATITPNAARVEEYNLKAMYKSPNGTIRAALDGTVFRAPILVKGIEPYVRTWKKPIIMARHAYGDVYKNTEYRVEGPGKAELVFTDASGRESRELIHQFTGAGIIQGMHNTDASIEGFARSCFKASSSVSLRICELPSCRNEILVFTDIGLYCCQRSRISHRGDAFEDDLRITDAFFQQFIDHADIAGNDRHFMFLSFVSIGQEFEVILLKPS